MKITRGGGAMVRVLVLGALCGCGGGGITSAAVASPGSAMPSLTDNVPDTEPNNTPAQAVPVGTLPLEPGGTTAAFYALAPSTSIGGADTADYYVFRTPANATSLLVNLCWSTSLGNLADASVYEVTNGQVGARLVAYNSTAACENNNRATVTVRGGQTYLLEVTSVTGAGTYYI